MGTLTGAEVLSKGVGGRDVFAFSRLPIATGEKRLWHLAECEPASCPLVGRVVSCLRARVLLTGQS